MVFQIAPSFLLSSFYHFDENQLIGLFKVLIEWYKLTPFTSNWKNNPPASMNKMKWRKISHLLCFSFSFKKMWIWKIVVWGNEYKTANWSLFNLNRKERERKTGFVSYFWTIGCSYTTSSPAVTNLKSHRCGGNQWAGMETSVGIWLH